MLTFWMCLRFLLHAFVHFRGTFPVSRSSLRSLTITLVLFLAHFVWFTWECL